MLLVLRVDRGLAWEDIALTFLDDPEAASEEDKKREAARLRKRFQIVKKRLGERAREVGLLPD
jgi:RNA polymerase sigma-70 factor (ECF subfamily)